MMAAFRLPFRDTGPGLLCLPPAGWKACGCGGGGDGGSGGLTQPSWTVRQLNGRKAGRTRYNVQGFHINLELPTSRFSKKTNTLLLVTKTIPNY